MQVKECLEKIIEKGKIDDMYVLSNMLDKSIEKIQECDIDWYKEVKTKLYVMAYGEHFTETMAEDIISAMRPYGMKWTLEETKDVQRQYGLTSIDPIEFWIVINSAYNDYRDLFNDNLDMYVKYVRNFINDDDAVKNKVWVYFNTIAKK